MAQLAGIGLTWYTWMEQGRDIQVSTQVLESIARVLQLTHEEKCHLFSLAGKSIANFSSCEPQLVSATVSHLLDNIHDIPAYIIDEHWSLLAWNAISIKVFGDFSLFPHEERNIVHMMFTNKSYMNLFVDWATHARGIIARFRLTYGKNSDDDWFSNFVNNLCKTNITFNDWWAMHDVHAMNEIIKEINHPKVGKMVFEFVSFDLSTNPNHKLIFHNPVYGTDTARKLDFLISGN